MDSRCNCSHFRICTVLVLHIMLDILAKYGDTNILLTGEINTGSIEFSLTNELNIFGDWVYEDEIRLMNGKEILIKDIHRNGKKIKFDENIKFFS
jgi:hypothetical protein